MSTDLVKNNASKKTLQQHYQSSTINNSIEFYTRTFQKRRQNTTMFRNTKTERIHHQQTSVARNVKLLQAEMILNETTDLYKEMKSMKNDKDMV